jgi:hypothetical protein
VIKAVCSAEICVESIGLVFFTNLNELRSLEQSADEDAVLLNDDCASDATEKVSNLFRDWSIGVIAWAPHATQRSQEFDVSLLGVLKRREHYPLTFENDQTTVGLLLRIHRTLKEIMIDPII